MSPIRRIRLPSRPRILPLAIACAVAASVPAAQAQSSERAVQPNAQPGVRVESVPQPALTPLRTSAQPAAVAARFPDPAVTFQTPAFQSGRTDFTSHAEMHGFVQGLRPRTAMLEVRTIGESQDGRIIPMLAFGTQGEDKPTVLIVAMQRGDAPAAGEAALVLAHRLAGGPLVDLLRSINVLIVPRANPDGAERQSRGTAGGIPLDADHLLLRTPEARALSDILARQRPDVVIVLGEFDPDWTTRFDGWVRFDAMLRTATVGNQSPALDRAAQRWFYNPMRAALDSDGMSSQWQLEPAAGDAGQRVSAGSVHADGAVNAAALRNSIALRHDSRGIGLGREHLLRRVHSHVTAVEAALRSAAANADALRRLTDEQRRATSASACTGEMVIESAPVIQRRMLVLLDAETGLDRSIAVEEVSSQAAKPVRTRSRPCGYLLQAADQPIADQLKALGVSVRRTEAPAALSVERFRALAVGRDFEIEPARVEAPSGMFFVSMSQPLANLAAAALEPDSPGSLFRSGVLDERKAPRVLRVIEPATLKAVDW